MCIIGHISRFRLTIPTTSSICIILFILLTAVSASGTVKWKLKTHPVKFGEDVRIVCTCPQYVTMEHMAWKIYPSGQNEQSGQIETIGMFNVSSNMNKYSIIQSYNESDVIYMLVIKNFDVTDLDHAYKCEFGFKYDNGKITINERDFIALPSGDTIEKLYFLRNGSVNAYIWIPHVYPKPICTADFKGVNITGTLNTTHIKQQVFYDTIIEVLYNANECDGDLQITCFVGMENITFKHHFNESCPKDTGTAMMTHSIITLILVMCGTLIGVGVFWYAIKGLKKRIYLRRNPTSEISQQNATNEMNAETHYDEIGSVYYAPNILVQTGHDIGMAPSQPNNSFEQINRSGKRLRVSNNAVKISFTTTSDESDNSYLVPFVTEHQQEVIDNSEQIMKTTYVTDESSLSSNDSETFLKSDRPYERSHSATDNEHAYAYCLSVENDGI